MCADGKRTTGRTRTARAALGRLLLASDPGSDNVRRWTREIGRELLRASAYVDAPNFTRLHPDDLAFLFAAYDARFTNGLCERVAGPGGVRFRLSSRMSRRGGATTRYRRADGAVEYEIAVASSLLFDGFRDGDPEVTVTGLPCRRRLDALLRVFEHEFVHLAEFLVWGESKCARDRFQGIARRLFGHRGHTHSLIVRSQRAASQGLTVGARVTFRYRGRWLEGTINRVTKRATVLVDDPAGDLFSDGQCYATYYVPLDALRLTPPRKAPQPSDRQEPSGR